MKSIARLIIAIPTLVMATGSAAVGQQFPSTAHGSFDGSVVQIPEATISLPSVDGSKASKAASNLNVPSTAGTRSVGSYQTVMDMDPMSVVQVPGNAPQPSLGSSNRSIAPSTPATNSSPIITMDRGNEITIPSSESFNSNQNVVIEQGQGQYIDQGQGQYVQGAQTYTTTDGEIFIDQGNFEGAEFETYNGNVTQVGDEYFIDESQLVGETTSVVRSRPAQRPIRQSRRTPGARNGGRVFTTAGVSALIMNRTYGENRNISTNGTQALSTGNTTFDTLGGVDVFVGRRRLNGLGWESRYFGLFPEDTSTQIGGNPTNLLPGLDQLTQFRQFRMPGIINFDTTAGDIFDQGDPHVLTRQTEIHNFELNLLKNGRTRRRASQTEYFVGFRYFQFGETLLAESIGTNQGDPFGSPESVGYFSTTENELYGIQIGTRSDYQIGSRLTLHVGLKGGAFNNTIRTRQRVDFRMPDGSISNPFIDGGDLDGQRFDIGTENDVRSVMGELDVATSFQVSNAARVRVGYRAIAISDIAFASEQIGDNFNDASDLLNPTTDGSLVLQGGYIGMEFAF